MHGANQIIKPGYKSRFNVQKLAYHTKCTRVIYQTLVYEQLQLSGKVQGSLLLQPS